MANESLTPANKPPLEALSQRLEELGGRLQRPRGHPRALPNLGRWLRILGPGLITGAADDDPSGIGTYSQAGAAFGTGLLWMALYLLPLMIAVQEMCGRIGLVTGKGIASIVKSHYSRRALRLSVALLLIANTINIGADLGAMAASTRLLLPQVPFYPSAEENIQSVPISSSGGPGMRGRDARASAVTRGAGADILSVVVRRIAGATSRCVRTCAIPATGTAMIAPTTPNTSNPMVMAMSTSRGSICTAQLITNGSTR
jgi:Natural resistance-associated macrophage protein-like